MSKEEEEKQFIREAKAEKEVQPKKAEPKAVVIAPPTLPLFRVVVSDDKAKREYHEWKLTQEYNVPELTFECVRCGAKATLPHLVDPVSTEP